MRFFQNCIFALEMKERRIICTSILLMLYMIVVAHGIVPHHHHDGVMTLHHEEKSQPIHHDDIAHYDIAEYYCNCTEKASVTDTSLFSFFTPLFFIASSVFEFMLNDSPAIPVVCYRPPDILPCATIDAQGLRAPPAVYC